MPTIKRLAGGLKQGSTSFMIGGATYTYEKSRDVDLADYTNGSSHKGCFFLRGCAGYLKTGANVNDSSGNTVVSEWSTSCTGI
jgi:hypothetical protein